MKKLFFFLVCAFLASCGQSYKVRELRTNNVYIIQHDVGFIKGDTIRANHSRVVIDSVMK